MTSLQTGIKQNLRDGGYFIPLAALTGQIYAYNSAANNFSTAAWAANNMGSRALSSILGPTSTNPSILRDMGRTVVSSLRTFRKVQVVLPNNSFAASTFGVGGQSGTTYGNDYLTGYIELGFEGYGTPAPVAHFGR
jgi:hypothetical protein